MATPRKAWFRVADSVLYEGWDDKMLATMIRLSAHLNTRWAREGRTTEEAGESALDPADIMKITGAKRLDYARLALSKLAAVVTLTVRYLDDKTFVHWPKWPEFQGLQPSGSPETTHESPPPPPPPHDAPARESSGASAPREPSGESSPRKPRRRSKSSLDLEAAEAAWPAIREAFAEHGKHLGERCGRDRAELLAKRLADGATADDLVAAVHGYVRDQGGSLDPQPNGWDPGKFFRPQTVFKADGFSDRVDAGRGPRPVKRKDWERMWGLG